MGTGAVPDAKPNSGFPKWIQSVVGTLAVLGVAGGIGLAVASSRLDERVKTVEGSVQVVQGTQIKVAVIETEVGNIKEDVTEVKKDVKEVLKQLQRLNGGGQ